MILTGDAISLAQQDGTITIDPFVPSALNPNSYNYRLGSMLLVANPRLGQFQEMEIPEGGLVLQPHSVYLGATLERIGSSMFVTTLLGRSSLGRLGLYLNVTADLGHVGAVSHWTLELAVVQPLRVYAGMTIGQVAFWRTVGDPTLYEGRYQGDVAPAPNRDSRLNGLPFTGGEALSPR